MVTAASFESANALMVKRGTWVFLTLVFVIAVAFSWLIPPMQSPDETSHIARAYMLARGSWLLQPPDRNVLPPEDTKVATFVKRVGGQSDVGGRVDLSLLRYMDANFDLALDSKLRISNTQKINLQSLQWSNESSFLAIPGTGYYLPLIYLPQATGLTLGMTFDLSIEQSYRLARAITLLVCFVFLALAYRLTPPNPLALAVLLLPMSLFQLLSPTIDGLTTSLGLFTVGLFVRNVTRKENTSCANPTVMAICVFVLATSRTHLLPLLLFPFVLAWQHKSRREFLVACAVAVGAVAWVLFALHQTTDTRMLRSHTTSELLNHYAWHPIEFFVVVFTSLTDQGLATFYQESFIGILGWLDTRLPNACYPILWTGLGACTLVSISFSSNRRDLALRLGLFGIAVASTVLIFFALLVTWTPHPTTVIQGVQGRYFVMPMVLLGYSLSDHIAEKTPLQHRLGAFVLIGFALASLSALTMTLLSRYH